jgi:hypothetical protein
MILALRFILGLASRPQAMAGTQLVPGTEQGGFIYQYFSAPFCQVCPMKPFSMLLQTSMEVLRPQLIFQNTTGGFGELGY